MISAVVLTKNSAATLARTLASLACVDEVVVLDNGSTDNTRQIAAEFSNTQWFTHPFTNFGHLRNLGAQYARNDWILVIDSDEALSPELQQWLAMSPPEPGSVYEFPFRNYYRDRWIRGCGWWPDRHIRLYHRNETRYRELRIHESLELQGLQVIARQEPFEHYSYRDAADFMRKLQSYATLFADEYMHQKRVRPGEACFRGLWTFFRSFILRRGFLYGSDGFLISFYQGATAYFKYRLLYERQHPVRF
jgi:glycosyltransferase involved in cell wall biosynthesis